MFDSYPAISMGGIEDSDICMNPSSPIPPHILQWNEWRRKNRDERISIWGQDLSGAYLRGVDLSEAGPSWLELAKSFPFLPPGGSTADFGANLSGADLSLANLIKAHLPGVDLSGANLSGADLSLANLYKADLSGVNLNGENLSEVNLAGAKLSGANLYNADLGAANLSMANLTEAKLFEANLSGADLSGADLSGVDLTGANLDNVNVSGVCWGQLGKYQTIKCRGIRAATCYGSPAFKRFVQDQDFIQEFQAGHPVWHFLWWLFTDCGQSFWRWLAWSGGLAVVFAVLYRFVLGPEAFNMKESLPSDFWTMLYYSVVTFTTLGFGDVTPKGPPATYFVMAEVVMGYGALGLLISILANKVARRS